MTMGKRLALIVVAAAILAGCGTEQTTPSQASSAGEWQSPVMPQPHALWVDGDGVEEVARIAVSLDGDLLLNDQILQKGNFETLDGRRQDDGSVRLVSVDRSSNEAVLLALQDGALTELQRLPAPSYQINGLCLYRDSQSLLSVFLLDERGGADQWLLDDARQPRKLRHLVMPPDAEFCTVDDARAALDERRRLQPDMRGHPSQHRHPVFNYIGDGLRRAGLDIPEEPVATDRHAPRQGRLITL